MTEVDRWQFWALAIGAIVGVHLLMPSTHPSPSLLGESIDLHLDRALLGGSESLCRGGVRDQLKTPAVASFGASHADYDARTGNAVIAGEVVSQNGFGATLKGRYACRLAREGNEWRVLSVAIE